MLLVHFRESNFIKSFPLTMCRQYLTQQYSLRSTDAGLVQDAIDSGGDKVILKMNFISCFTKEDKWLCKSVQIIRTNSMEQIHEYLCNKYIEFSFMNNKLNTYIVLLCRRSLVCSPCTCNGG